MSANDLIEAAAEHVRGTRTPYRIGVWPFIAEIDALIKLAPSVAHHDTGLRYHQDVLAALRQAKAYALLSINEAGD